MISYLNKKYDTGAKTFLDILETFRSDPSLILSKPHTKVKKLIKDTLDKYFKENSKAFEFRNANMGDIIDMLQ